MPLQAGDLRWARSADMSDEDNGGGPPTSQLIPDGASNAAGLPDISEDDRVGGKVNVVQVHAVLRNTDTDPLLGANVIVAEPPDDENVGITLIKSPGTFARRPDLVRLVEATSTPGSEFNGFMLENHVAQDRGLRIAQRPGVNPPSVNTTLALVIDEGLPTEKKDFVRVRRVTVTQQIFTMADGAGNPIDFLVQISTCELFSPIKFSFAGTAANRFYARGTGKTMIRSVVFSDAGTFYSASRLQAPVVPADMDLQLASVYSQIVPNTRTETPLLNQRPGGQRTLELIDAYGTLQVSAASHSERIYITEENQGQAYVFKLTPPPARNSVSVDYMALASWSTLVDDGAGAVGDGPGSGTVDYGLGDLSVSFDALPDYNTFVLVQWADTAPYVNNCAAGSITLAQAPEFALDLTPGVNTDGASVTWPSGGATKTATVSAAGVISGDATGFASGALSKAYIRPTAMPDAGSGFTWTYTSRPTLVENIASPSLDVAGFALLPTAQEPIPGTVRVRWTTARKVSQSSGADLAGTGITSSTQLSSSRASFTQTSQSATSDTLVVVNEISDDGVGGFGDPARGSVNYAGKAVNLRLVDQGASTGSYRSDQSETVYFKFILESMTA